MKNCMALQRAKKIAYIRGNHPGRGTGPDKEIMLSGFYLLDKEMAIKDVLESIFFAKWKGKCMEGQLLKGRCNAMMKLICRFGDLIGTWLEILLHVACYWRLWHVCALMAPSALQLQDFPKQYLTGIIHP